LLISLPDRISFAVLTAFWARHARLGQNLPNYRADPKYKGQALKPLGKRERQASVPSRKYRLLSALRVICREDHWDGAANQAVTG
jgi:hypothetical protein